MSKSMVKILGLLLVSLLPISTSGQRIGIDICSCAPSQYEFEFDFDLACPPVNITQGDAVASTACLTSPVEDEQLEDKIPILVRTIDVFELDQNLDVMTREQISGSFLDGDRFTYKSVVAASGETDPTRLPRAIQYVINGINKLGEEIVNLVVITFSNSCQAYPVLIPGQYAGWVRFVSNICAFIYLSFLLILLRLTTTTSICSFAIRLNWRTLYTSIVRSFQLKHLLYSRQLLLTCSQLLIQLLNQQLQISLRVQLRQCPCLWITVC